MRKIKRANSRDEIRKEQTPIYILRFNVPEKYQSEVSFKMFDSNFACASYKDACNSIPAWWQVINEIFHSTIPISSIEVIPIFLINNTWSRHVGNDLYDKQLQELEAIKTNKKTIND